MKTSLGAVAAACCILASNAHAQAIDPVPEQPLVKNLVHNIVADQKTIWTSPLHMTRANAEWALLFGAVTGVLIATDHQTSTPLPNTRDQIRVSGYVSNAGSVYSLAGISSGFYLLGSLTGKEKARETGLVSAEALVDGIVVLEAFKLAARRQRPFEGDGHGHFFHGGSSFPSGHTMESFALASVIAHEYPSRKVGLLAYGVASLVAASRFTGRKHFASDIVGPAAVGWLMGTYVYDRRAATNHVKATALHSLLSPHATPLIQPQSRQYGLALAW